MTKAERATMQDRLTEMEREIKVMKTKLDDDVTWYEQEWYAGTFAHGEGAAITTAVSGKCKTIATTHTKEMTKWIIGSQKLKKASIALYKRMLQPLYDAELRDCRDAVNDALEAMGVEVG